MNDNSHLLKLCFVEKNNSPAPPSFNNENPHDYFNGGSPTRQQIRRNSDHEQYLSPVRNSKNARDASVASYGLVSPDHQNEQQVRAQLDEHIKRLQANVKTLHSESHEDFLARIDPHAHASKLQKEEALKFKRLFDEKEQLAHDLNHERQERKTAESLAHIDKVDANNRNDRLVEEKSHEGDFRVLSSQFFFKF